jgi:hypothetical protein
MRGVDDSDPVSSDIDFYWSNVVVAIDLEAG